MYVCVLLRLTVFESILCMVVYKFIATYEHEYLKKRLHVSHVCIMRVYLRMYPYCIS